MSLRAKLKQRRLAHLDQIQVASPCPARWEDMAGDEKVRFCQGCQLHVYNLSAMDVEEAAERISRNADRLCVRFYRRGDGTILTRDCPVGAERARVKRRTTVQDAAAGLLGVGIVSMLFMPTMGAVARPEARVAALHSATKAGDLTLLRRLLDSGSDPDSRMKSGITPLMRAAEAGDVEVVRLLLQHGADVHARDLQGRSAVQLARKQKHRRVVMLLRRAGARD